MRRIKRLSEEDDAAIGIGTLIVFIGLILVAAIASAVIVGVMGNLQERAKRTGEDTQENVAPPLKVQHATGSSDGEDLTQMNFTISAIEGSRGYDLSNLMIEVTVLEDGGGSGHSSRFVEDAVGDVDDTFDIVWLTADKDYDGGDGDTFLSTDELAEITIDTSDTEIEQTGESADVSIKFMASEGSPPTLFETVTPSEYPTGEFELK